MNKVIRWFSVFVICFGVLFTVPVKPVKASSSFFINSQLDIVDANPGNGVCATSTNVCTLRAAIMEANALPGADTIILSPVRYTLLLDGNPSADNDDNSVSGDLDVTDELTIQVGPTSGKATIQGRGWTERIIENLTSEGSAGLTLINIIIKTGNSTERGGGLLNTGPAELINVTIENNVSASNGGGISSTGALTIVNSIIRNNTSNDGTNGGGGIHYVGQNILTITNTTISGNTAKNGGGLLVEKNLDASGPSIIYGSTFSGNIALSNGGAIFATKNGGVELVNSTISGNSANNDGGGLYGHISHETNIRYKLASVTITNNTADADSNGGGNGGGIATNNQPDSIFISKNTIIAGNFDLSTGSSPVRPDCSLTLTSEGYNLIHQTTGCTIVGDTTGNILGAFDGLSPLQNWGGLTSTHIPSYGIGLDAGNPNGCTDFQGNLLSDDQIGEPRHQGHAGIIGVCDIGSVELEQPV
ncbi:MAG TPA: hypothetical protein DIW23_12000 [Anaerolineae bacterium]|nr:hypothetical protein [Anaerolineae bacterium]HRJ75686.1 hypothetical protein [Anaerolineales bacterium]